MRGFAARPSTPNFRLQLRQRDLEMPLAESRRRSSRASRRCSASRSVGSSSCSRCSPACSFSSSARLTGVHRHLHERLGEADLRAGAPDARASRACRSCACCAAWRRSRCRRRAAAATSMRSRPCAIDRWFSFSAPLRVALYSSSPLCDRAGEEAEDADVADVRLALRLEDERGERARRRWRGSRPSWSPSAPVNAWSSSISYAFGISSTIVESTARVP